MITEEMLMVDAWNLLAQRGLDSDFLAGQPEHHRDLLQLGIQVGLSVAVDAHCAELRELISKCK